MDRFKASGNWFRDEDTSKMVSGTLGYSSAGLNLHLIGNFTEGWRPSSCTYGKLFGIVGDCPYGSFVTLFDSFLKKSRLRSVGIGTETIFANKAIIGDFHLREERPIETIGLRFTYLNDWTAGNSFDVAMPGRAGENEFRITYRRPDPIVHRTQSEVINVGFSVKTSAGRDSAGMSGESHIVVRPATPMNHSDAIGRYMSPIRDLVTFATDTPNGVDEVALFAVKIGEGDLRNKLYFIFDPIFRVKKRKDLLRPGDMLFLLSESQGAGINIFEKWFEFVNKNDAFTLVYFAYQYAPPRYLDEKFLRLMSAFTLLCISLRGPSRRGIQLVSAVETALSGILAGEERELLGHVIPVESNVHMPFHLLDLLNEHGDLLDQLIGNDRRGFVRSITDTLGYVESRSSGSLGSVLHGQSMVNAMSVIQVLIKILVLSELGFEGGDVARFIQRNSYFEYLRTSIDAS